jgi:hypothetical protein
MLRKITPEGFPQLFQQRDDGHGAAAKVVKAVDELLSVGTAVYTHQVDDGYQMPHALRPANSDEKAAAFISGAGAPRSATTPTAKHEAGKTICGSTRRF